jgi:hypothetical protein
VGAKECGFTAAVVKKDIIDYELEVGICILLENKRQDLINVIYVQIEALTDCASSVSISHIRSE